MLCAAASKMCADTRRNVEGKKKGWMTTLASATGNVLKRENASSRQAAMVYAQGHARQPETDLEKSLHGIDQLP